MVGFSGDHSLGFVIVCADSTVALLPAGKFCVTSGKVNTGLLPRKAVVFTKTSAGSVVWFSSETRREIWALVWLTSGVVKKVPQWETCTGDCLTSHTLR